MGGDSILPLQRCHVPRRAEDHGDALASQRRNLVNGLIRGRNQHVPRVEVRFAEDEPLGARRVGIKAGDDDIGATDSEGIIEAIEVGGDQLRLDVKTARHVAGEVGIKALDLPLRVDVLEGRKGRVHRHT